jgi:uncharacterized membrane protein
MGAVVKEPTVNDRWLGAACYLSFLVVVPILYKPRSEFLARHCRLGFSLLFAEVVFAFVLHIVNRTIGQIPFLGLFITMLLYLAIFLLWLLLSVIGFVKALSGEDCTFPFLDELAQRVPIHATVETFT